MATPLTPELWGGAGCTLATPLGAVLVVLGVDVVEVEVEVVVEVEVGVGLEVEVVAGGCARGGAPPPCAADALVVVVRVGLALDVRAGTLLRPLPGLAPLDAPEPQVEATTA